MSTDVDEPWPPDPELDEVAMPSLEEPWPTDPEFNEAAILDDLPPIGDDPEDDEGSMPNEETCSHPEEPIGNDAVAPLDQPIAKPRPKPRYTLPPRYTRPRTFVPNVPPMREQDGHGITIYSYSCAVDAPAKILRKIKQPIYWLDCCPFRDPGKRTRHDGRHDLVMVQMVQHYAFGQLLSRVKNEVERCLAAGYKTIVLAFWCEHGKHRSVCGAELFGQVLKRVLPLSTVEIEHLTQQENNSNHWQTCCDCYYPKLTYLNGVVQLWQDRRQ
jgi:hypothetical protein